MKRKPDGFSGQRIVVLPHGVVAAALKHLLLRNLLPTDIGFYPKARGHFIERLVGIDQSILIYCIKGQGWAEIGENRHEIHPGELFVIPPGTPHKYGASDHQPWTIYWVHIQGESNLLLLSEMGITKTKPVHGFGRNPRLLALFDELLETMEHGYASSNLLYASQILAYLVGLIIWVHTVARMTPSRHTQKWRKELPMCDNLPTGPPSLFRSPLRQYELA